MLLLVLLWVHLLIVLRIGFADGGLLTGMGADIGKKISTDMAT